MPVEDLPLSILQSCQRGDRAAWARFVDHYAPPLLRYVKRLTSNSPESEDLLQDVLVRVLEALPRYEPRGSLTSWVFTIAANRVRDFFRGAARARDRRSLVESETASSAPVRSGLSGPEQAQESAWFEHALREAIEALPETQREVLLLRLEAGLSFKQIARLQEVPLNTALGRMRYAMLRLKDKLAPFVQKVT